jgi:hypothetical protein
MREMSRVWAPKRPLKIREQVLELATPDFLALQARRCHGGLLSWKLRKTTGEISELLGALHKQFLDLLRRGAHLCKERPRPHGISHVRGELVHLTK